jgi:hypothetical protein
MNRRILLSLGAGLVVGCAVWLSVILCAPDLYVERAGAIIFYSSLAATVVIFITLCFSEYLLLKATNRVDS